MKKEEAKEEINKLTKLFTEQLNVGLNKEYSGSKKEQKSVVESHFSYQPELEPSFQKRINDITSFGKYEESTKKIQNMLEGSRSLLEKAESEQLPAITHLPVVSNNEELFTPPDFLAECRKFIETSNKKKIEEFEEDIPIPSETEDEKKLTFGTILSDSRSMMPNLTNFNQLTFS